MSKEYEWEFVGECDCGRRVTLPLRMTVEEAKRGVRIRCGECRSITAATPDEDGIGPVVPA